MNADRTQLRSIKTSDLVVNGVGTFSVSSFTVQEAINRPPVVSVTCFPKAATDFIPIMTEAEKSLNLFHARAADVIYNRPTSVNCRFSVTHTAEGKDQLLELAGILGSSSPQLSKSGSAGLQLTIAHPVNVLSTADTSIYAGYSDPGSVIESGPQLKNSILHTNNLADLILAVLKGWETDFKQRAAWAYPTSPAAAEALVNRHTAGQPGRDYLRKILQDSRASLALPVLDFIPEGDRLGLVSDLHKAMSSSGDLMSGVFGSGGIGYNMGLLWRIPANSAWSTVARSMDATGAPASRTLRASYTNYNPSVGSSDGIPVRGVRMLVKNIPMPQSNMVLIGDTISPVDLYVGYPENAVKEGRPRIVTINAPQWLSLATIKSGGLPAAEYKPDAHKGKPVPAKAMRRIFRQHTKASETLAGTTVDLLREWARMHYIYTALDTSTETLSMPLNLTAANVGEVLTVESSGGTPLYDGFVAGVTHAVDLANNQASTTVQFTHVRPHGFVLPEN